VPIDPKTLPRDADTLRKIVLDLIEQLDRSPAEQNKYQNLLRELLEAQRNRKSEQLTKEQLALFEAAWQAQNPQDRREDPGDDDDDIDSAPQGAGQSSQTDPRKRGGRQALARHLTRERIVYDLAEAKKHCAGCGKDLRLIEEETSERYEYIPASFKVIEDVRRKYACDCTIRTAELWRSQSEHAGRQNATELHAWPFREKLPEIVRRGRCCAAGTHESPSDPKESKCGRETHRPSICPTL